MWRPHAENFVDIPASRPERAFVSEVPSGTTRHLRRIAQITEASNEIGTGIASKPAVAGRLRRRLLISWWENCPKNRCSARELKVIKWVTLVQNRFGVVASRTAPGVGSVRRQPCGLDSSSAITVSTYSKNSCTGGAAFWTASR